MANESCYCLLVICYGHVQGTFSPLDHLILAARIIIFPRFADEEMDPLRGYTVRLHRKYLEAGVRKTLTLGRVFNGQNLPWHRLEWMADEARCEGPRDLEKSPGRECKTSKANKGAAGLAGSGQDRTSSLIRRPSARVQSSEVWDVTTCGKRVHC